MARYDLQDADDLAALASQLETTTQHSDSTASHARRRRLPVAFGNSAGKAILLGLLFTLIVGGGIMVAARGLLGFGAQAGGRVVPDVTNRTMAQAQSAVTQAKLRPVVKYEPMSKKTAGTVVGQEPAAGSKAKDGSDVTIFVAGKAPAGATTGAVPLPPPSHGGSTPRGSQGTVPPPVSTAHQHPATVPATAVALTVPDVEGMVDMKARQKLEALGLRTEVKSTHDAGQPDRIVLTAIPRPGSPIQKGSLVVLTVNAVQQQQSTGATVQPAPASAATVTLKNYVGVSFQQAVYDLRSQGLEATWTYTPSRLQPANCVVKTQPPAGSQLAPGTRVMLVVAK